MREQRVSGRRKWILHLTKQKILGKGLKVSLGFITCSPSLAFDRIQWGHGLGRQRGVSQVPVKGVNKRHEHCCSGFSSKWVVWTGKNIQRTQDQGRVIKDLRNRRLFRKKRWTKRKKLAMEDRERRTGEWGPRLMEMCGIRRWWGAGHTQDDSFFWQWEWMGGEEHKSKWWGRLRDNPLSLQTS